MKFIFSTLFSVFMVTALAANGEGHKQTLPILAHWSFDSSVEGSCPDAGPHGLSADLNDEATLVAAPGGSALSLTAGTGGFAQLPASDVFTLRRPFTIAAWVMPQGSGQMEIFCLKTDSLDRGYRLRNFWGQPVFEAGVGRPEPVTVRSEANALIQDNWAHVAAAWDGRRLLMYVNAELVAETPLDEPPYAYNGGQPVIGNYLTSKTAYPFVGQIDDVILLDGAADADAIWKLAAQREAEATEPQ